MGKMTQEVAQPSGLSAVLTVLPEVEGSQQGGIWKMSTHGSLLACLSCITYLALNPTYCITMDMNNMGRDETK